MIVGIAGPKQSGKTTLANEFHLRLGFQVDTFAAPIRQFVASILGVTLAELERVKEQPVAWLGGITPRKMMQTVGTEWGRSMIHPEMWVDSLIIRNQCFDATVNIVVPDVRFPNEARAIIHAGGIVIGVRRPGTEYGDGHVSEQPLPDELVAGWIENSADVQGLYIAALEAILKHK